MTLVGHRIEFHEFKIPVTKLVDGKVVPVYEIDENGDVIMDGDEPRIATRIARQPVQVKIVLSPEEERATRDRWAAAEAYEASEERQLEHDDSWLIQRWPDRRQVRLFYQLCKAVPVDRRTALMTDFINDVDTARTQRRAEEIP